MGEEGERALIRWIMCETKYEQQQNPTKNFEKDVNISRLSAVVKTSFEFVLRVGLVSGRIRASFRIAFEIFARRVACLVNFYIKGLFF